MAYQYAPSKSSLVDFFVEEVFYLNKREKIMSMDFLILFTYMFDSEVIRVKRI